MATTPLFAADVATLKSKLRLSGVPSVSDADDIINEAVLTVRAGFYRELGKTTVDAIVALPFVEDPTTDDEIKRAVANTTEVKWVRAELIRSLPMMFIDGSADQTQVYHDEALFRDASTAQLNEERVRLETDIEVNLALLRGEQSIGTEGAGLRAETVSPECERPHPGDTYLPRYTKGLF